MTFLTIWKYLFQLSVVCIQISAIKNTCGKFISNVAAMTFKNICFRPTPCYFTGGAEGRINLLARRGEEIQMHFFSQSPPPPGGE